MWMERISNARRKVIITRRTTHSRNIEISLRWIASKLSKNLPNEFLRLRMMDELRFQIRQQGGIFSYVHEKLRRFGIAARKCLANHLIGKSDERGGPGTRRVDQKLSVVECLTSLLVAHNWIDVDRIHDIAP